MPKTPVRPHDGASSEEEREQPRSHRKADHASPPASAPADEVEDEENDAEEFEIEKILKHRNGMFEGRMGYHVKWKGYDKSEDNSWVDEADCGNAQELIDEYWRTTKKKPAPSTKQPRQSTSSQVSGTRRKSIQDSDTEIPPAKKRATIATSAKLGGVQVASKQNGRKSLGSVAKDSDGDDVMAGGDDQASSANEEEWDNMERFKGMSSWEKIVQKIDTIERVEGGKKLLVYLRLKRGVKGIAESSICREKMPNLMLDFYESNLRWREATDGDDI